MDNVNIKLHGFQKILIEKLSKEDVMKFNELLIEGLESEHMNYHLKKLINFGLVQKDGEGYSLTNSGKDYMNLMDDNVKIIEKQPKTSVLLHVVRIAKDGETEQLVSKRTIHPYKGKIGRLTGKVRFGESLQEAASRELFEETGLVAESYVLEEVYHKTRKDENGDAIQDVLFYRFFITGISGDFIKRTPTQENLWIREDDGIEYDFFDDFNPETRDEPRELTFTESIEDADGF